jgi:hypothetical protein
LEQIEYHTGLDPAANSDDKDTGFGVSIATSARERKRRLIWLGWLDSEGGESPFKDGITWVSCAGTWSNRLGLELFVVGRRRKRAMDVMPSRQTEARD